MGDGVQTRGGLRVREDGFSECGAVEAAIRPDERRAELGGDASRQRRSRPGEFVRDFIGVDDRRAATAEELGG